MRNNQLAVKAAIPTNNILTPNMMPFGRLALRAHDVISPEPVKVGTSGRSLLKVLLTRFSEFGE